VAEHGGTLVGSTDDAQGLARRAENLRECAKQARTIARSLGPYLDDAVSKAAPRADAMMTGFGGPAVGDSAIWLGPFADQCTARLKQRQSKLASMAAALMADATRWESEATRLDGEAKAAKTAPTGNTGSATGGGR